jgi:hypothetical protein
MKAEHRHELKTNELADWLAHLPQWAKDNRTTLVAGAAIVVVAVVVYFWIFRHGNIASAQTRVRLTNLVTQLPAQKNSLARALAQQTDQSYLLLDVARDLQDFAETADNDNMAALAWIERAEALRTELHYQLGEVTADERGKRIAQAQTSYQQALERAVGNATLGALWSSSRRRRHSLPRARCQRSSSGRVMRTGRRWSPYPPMRMSGPFCRSARCSRPAPVTRMRRSSFPCPPT